MNRRIVRRFVEKMVTWLVGSRDEGDASPNDRLKREQAYKQKTWEELAAPLRSDDPNTALSAYQSLHKLKEQLSYRAEEARKKAAEHSNEAAHLKAQAALWLSHVVELSIDTKKTVPPLRWMNGVPPDHGCYR